MASETKNHRRKYGSKGAIIMYNNNDFYNNYGFTNNDFGTVRSEPAAPSAPTPTAKKEKKKHRGMKTAALVLACSLLSGVTGAAAVSAVNTTQPNSTTLTQSSRSTAAVEMAYVDGETEMTAAQVYAANVNSTVGITTSITTNYFGFRTSAAAAGSGFIISSDGYIITNYHVVEDSNAVTVTTYDGKTYDAVIVGCDESNDLAVLKIDAESLTPVVLGDSDALNVGDDVIAIGNPLGELTFSLTKGTVSALDREVTLSSDVTMKLIQTDAAINSGNSGGALFNMYGEVVGITNAKYSSGSSSEASIDNIGFAIPMNSVKSIITSIIEKGYVSKPYIGVQLSDASNAALIYSVESGSPAEEAGLKANDIVTAANGKEITCASDLKALVGDLTPGDALILTVIRGNEETTLTINVGEKQQSAQYSSNADTSGYPAYGDSAEGDLDDFFNQFGMPFDYSGGSARG